MTEFWLFEYAIPSVEKNDLFFNNLKLLYTSAIFLENKCHLIFVYNAKTFIHFSCCLKCNFTNFQPALYCYSVISTCNWTMFTCSLYYLHWEIHIYSSAKDFWQLQYFHKNYRLYYHIFVFPPTDSQTDREYLTEQLLWEYFYHWKQYRNISTL